MITSLLRERAPDQVDGEEEPTKREARKEPLAVAQWNGQG
jgi:hypothetical protein